MRRDLKILLGTLAVGAAVGWGPRLPSALSSMDTFRVTEVDVRGTRYLTADSVVARLELDSYASVWSDKEVWAERVEAHPLVRDVEIRRRLPNGLKVTVEERRPVALAATPILEPVDGEGYRLPIDPVRYSLDLPIVSARKHPPAGSNVFPQEVRVLARELERLRISDEEFVKRISTVRRREDGAVVLRLTAPDVDLVVPAGVSAETLRRGQAALNDAMARNPGRVPVAVDIRFQDQVVVRHSTER